MKTLKILVLGIAVFASTPNFAQVAVNVNIGRPAWGPVVTTQEYYYLPDVDAYYDIPHGQFIYLNNGGWTRAKALPARYRTYNLNTGRVVVINDYHGNAPYVHYKTHKVKYKGNNGNHYGQNKGKGNGKGHGKGKGKKG